MHNFINQNKKWGIILVIALMLTLGGFGIASAAEFPSGEVIPAGETIDDDVFIYGENVVVDGNVNGMLFATGSTVTINGAVSGDALIAGETIIVTESAIIDGNLFIGGADVNLNGNVSGSLFVGSSDMEIGPSASVGRNTYFGGFNLTAKEGSTIGRDLYIGGYQAVLSGNVERDLSFGGAAIELNGRVGRNATLNVGDVERTRESASTLSVNPYVRRYVEEIIEPGIHVTDSASIGGNLTYTSSQDVTAELESVTLGKVVYRIPEGLKEAEGADRGLTARKLASNFIKLMALGALALWLLSKPFKQLADAAYAEPLKAIGWGFVLIAIGCLAALIVPLVFLLLGILLGFLSLGGLLYFWFGIIGVSLLLAFMLFFFTVFTVSKILAAFMFGRWLIQGIFKHESENVWLNLLLGVLFYVLVSAIPVVGFLAGLTATLIGSGAFWLVYIQKKATN